MPVTTESIHPAQVNALVPLEDAQARNAQLHFLLHPDTTLFEASAIVISRQTTQFEAFATTMRSNVPGYAEASEAQLLAIYNKSYVVPRGIKIIGKLHRVMDQAAPVALAIRIQYPVFSEIQHDRFRKAAEKSGETDL